jgi:PAS domain-containing protein
MKQRHLSIDEIAAQMMPTPDEIRLQLEFLELSEHDLSLLKSLHSNLAHAQYGMIESFYNHLLRFPALRSLLPDPRTIERLKHTQVAYFSGISAGDYGPDYVQHRLRVGIVHQRVGLSPQWYIGAYRKYLSELIPILHHLLGNDTARFQACYNALLKVVCFDMTLAIDTYMRSDQQEIMQLHDYSEKIINSLPTGVLILKRDRTIHAMNPALMAMFNLNPQQLGQTLKPLIGDARLHENIDKAFHEQVFDSNFMISHAIDGDKMRHLRCNISQALLLEQDLLILNMEDVTTLVAG